MKRLHRTLVFLLLFVLVMEGCAKAGTDQAVVRSADQLVETPNLKASPANLPVTRRLTVFAAASLTGAFRAIANDYEIAHPGVIVTLNFAGSQILRTQLEQGATADIFASADHKNMEVLLAEGLVDKNTTTDFASNQMVVILPYKNQANLQDLEDLAKPGVKIVLADQSVPAGNYARQILEKMSQDSQYGGEFKNKVLANVVSNETDVKQVVTKVELGEADAGIVYSSDAMAAPDLGTIIIPEKYNVVASYPIAIPYSAKEPALASDFLAYVISPAGQAILLKWGFGPMPH
jgi:molybdate transport system substrate-binding protein